ncbi:uncharacterized protein JCM15063_006009 [Sporobolomyces koalae]|uniref:uncharacterized protein n=1 Tax=Sporobolomyces koalae TaxID=500713 RepID=UPI0031721F8D
MPPKKNNNSSKKKKANPLRGYGTVSVPRKKVEPTDEDDQQTPEGAALDQTAPGGDANGSTVASAVPEGGAAGAGPAGAGPAGEDTSKGSWDDPEEVEKRDLLSLAERIRPACDKEINRVIKVIDYERRQSKVMPGYAWTDQDLQRRILALALEELSSEPPLASSESLEKTISKVATLFGILEQLGFSSNRIQECLDKVKQLELEDCLDWLFLNCEAEELACEGPAASGIVSSVNEEPVQDVSTGTTASTTTTINGNTPIRTESSPSSPPSPDSKDPSKRSTSNSNPVSPRQPRSRTTTASTLSPPAAAKNGATTSTTKKEEVASTFADLRARILAAEDQKKREKKAKKLNGTNKRSIISPEVRKSEVERAADSTSEDSDDSGSESDDSDSSSSAPAAANEEEEDEDTLAVDSNTRYAQLKLEISELQRAQGAFKRASKSKGPKKNSIGSKAEEEWIDTRLEQARNKLKEIEGDYTFRKTDAEKLYREERTKLDSLQLAAKLKGTTLESKFIPQFPKDDAGSESIVDPAETPVNASALSSPTLVNGSTHGGAGEDQESGFFGNLLEEAVASGTTTTSEEQATAIPTREFSLPKSFSGKTPKLSLEETVRKLDKPATIKFVNLTNRARTVRASVTIRWSDHRVQEWGMTDMACPDQPQAYNYIATIALFAVAGSTAVNKQLPTVFRDLWDELVKTKKEQDEEDYRDKLKLYRKIAEPRCHESATKDARASKGDKAIGGDEHQIMLPTQISPEASERIQQEIFQRQMWPTYQEMLRQRANLPIAAYRSEIMQTIENSQCIVLCGETGCGKSTQVPSFILEHDMRLGRPVKIFCTEPRRISAISLAQRVSSELGEGTNACGTRNSLVGYSIRLDSAVSASTRIVYATTGIVLRMLEGRESLADVTHIIIDEVHERSIDSDFLLIVLREILEVRKDLKVILMSATVDAEKIADYMGGCPVVRVPGRTHPVTPYYLEDVVELTRYRLDPHSDSQFVARSKRGYGARQRRSDDVPMDDDEEFDIPADSSEITSAPLSKQSRITLDCMDHHAINYDLILLLLEQLCFYKQDLVQFSSAILVFLPSLESIRRLTDILEAHPAFGSNQFLVLPLHSTISNENQGLVFNIPRPGVRKIVISTNIAETGVTIPDITAVIDTGKHREMRFDEKRQISRLVETFVAQSNAAQRRGRAGRVREGVAFHLFTRHRHDNYMAEHPQPEMTRLSLQDLALRIKIMKIGTGAIEETLLKALDPPLVVNIQRAVSSLIEVKALTSTEEITPLGRHLAKLPMDVHLGLFLIMSCIFGCLDAALTITAALNSKSPWLTPFGREAEADAVKRNFKVENSDFLTTYNAYCSWREASANGYEREFTRKSFLSQQNLQQIEELRQQFFSFLVDAGFISITDQERRQLISTKYGKSRTRFVRVPDDLDANSKDPRAVMACLAASMYPKLLVIDPQNGSMRTLANSAPAAIHPSSVNFAPGRRIDFGQNTRFVAFFTAMHTKKLYVWESGSVDERAVHLLCGNAEIQLAAHSLSIDRKIRTRLEPKTSIAIKVLRQQWQALFKKKMIDPSAPLEGHQQWLDLLVEALESPKKKAEEEEKKRTREPVKLTLTAH